MKLCPQFKPRKAAGALLAAVALLLASLFLPAAGASVAVRMQPQKGSEPLRGSPQSTSSATALGQPGISFRYAGTLGVTEQPYIADDQHLNRPNGLYIDGGDNLYVIEEYGSRVLKFNSSGSKVLTLGRAGLLRHDPGFFNRPKQATVDNRGNIWVVDEHRVTQYDTNGNLLQQLPPDDPWSSGDDNVHFDNPSGIAFDSAGRLYVADTQNHRIQVYTLVDATLVYSTTIGVTNVPGSDNSHFSRPEQIVVDSNDRLYVADVENFRVQRCTYAAGWTCATFHGTGSQGSDSDELGWAGGMGIDSRDNIYITDSGNTRIKKCDSDGNCEIFASGFAWPADVAVDSAGNVYVSDWNNCTIYRYDSSGNFLNTFVGESGAPYLTDNNHFNAPYGVAVDGNRNVYVTTTHGYRLFKLNTSGTVEWMKGIPGVWGSDNAHFGSWWDGPNNVAVDANGKVYVADTGNHRIQIYDGNGNFVATLGSYGSGDYEFDAPDGVAVDRTGNIYVADSGNHRVQIYDGNRTYRATLGVADVPGSDNTHFNRPYGVAADSAGNIYVADSDNNRVQVFDRNLNYVRTLGTTGEWGDDFDHFSTPRDVAVDAQGRIYVADAYNQRVQVFDSSGAYLTTIGGLWGNNSSEFREAMAVDVDAQGYVYVADPSNHRVQKFAPGVPRWTQVNLNGFGDRRNAGILTLAPFRGHLYAGTYNWSGNGAQLWRLNTGEWSSVTVDGFGDTGNVGIDHLIEFNGQLYAGTWNWDSADDTTRGGQVWRSSNGNTWSQVVTGGFGDPTNGEVFRFVAFNNQMYASTWSHTSTHGTEIWRSSTGNIGDWEKVVSNGFGDADNEAVISFEVFNGYLYAGTRNSSTGTQVWRTHDGAVWTQVNTDGFADPYNRSVTLQAFNEYLFAGTGNDVDGDNPGVELWRCRRCDGSDWQPVPIDKGFRNTENRAIHSMVVLDNALYAVPYNRTTGMEVWRTTDGTTWEQAGPDGLGDSNNYGPYWDNSVTLFGDRLYIGTWNEANGGEVWLDLHNQTFLPLLRRNSAPATTPAVCDGSFEASRFVPCWSHGGELPARPVTQLYNGDPPHIGHYSALLGNSDWGVGWPDPIPAGSAWIEQRIQVPNTSNPRLTFFYRIASYDVMQGTRLWDTLDVTINGTPNVVFRDGPDRPPANQGTLYDGGWKLAAVDLGAWRGQEVALRFAVWNREYDPRDGTDYYNTWAYVDEVRVEW